MISTLVTFVCNTHPNFLAFFYSTPIFYKSEIISPYGLTAFGGNFSPIFLGGKYGCIFEKCPQKTCRETWTKSAKQIRFKLFARNQGMLARVLSADSPLSLRSPLLWIPPPALGWGPWRRWWRRPQSQQRSGRSQTPPHRPLPPTPAANGFGTSRSCFPTGTHGAWKHWSVYTYLPVPSLPHTSTPSSARVGVPPLRSPRRPIKPSSVSSSRPPHGAPCGASRALWF